MPPEEIAIPPMEVMIALNIDPSAVDIEGSRNYLAKAYDIVTQMKPLYLKYRGTKQIQSYVRKSDTDYGTYFQFDDYNLSVSYASKQKGKPLAGGIIYELAVNKFLLIGTMCTLTFRPKVGENLKVDFLKLEEGELVNGDWKAGRILNGDEKMSIKFGDMPKCMYVELYKY